MCRGVRRTLEHEVPPTLDLSGRYGKGQGTGDSPLLQTWGRDGRVVMTLGFSWTTDDPSRPRAWTSFYSGGNGVGTSRTVPSHTLVRVWSGGLRLRAPGRSETHSWSPDLLSPRHPSLGRSDFWVIVVYVYTGVIGEGRKREGQSSIPPSPVHRVRSEKRQGPPEGPPSQLGRRSRPPPPPHSSTTPVSRTTPLFLVGLSLFVYHPHPTVTAGVVSTVPDPGPKVKVQVTEGLKYRPTGICCAKETRSARVDILPLLCPWLECRQLT